MPSDYHAGADIGGGAQGDPLGAPLAPSRGWEETGSGRNGTGSRLYRRGRAARQTHMGLFAASVPTVEMLPQWGFWFR
jgi:hypothetical protein